MLTEEQDNSIKWAEEIVQTTKRSKSDIKHIRNLLNVIYEQFTEIETFYVKK